MKPVQLIALAGLAVATVHAQSQVVRPTTAPHAPRSVDPTRAEQVAAQQAAATQAPPRMLAQVPDELAATSGPDVALDPLAHVTGGIGFGSADGVLVGVGPRYKAGFGARGPSVTPPLGMQAARSLPLAFELESIHVGSSLVAAGGAASPAVAERTVSYARGATVTEKYELRGDGIEQSFVFTSLPAVDGDLVVRGLVLTELAAPAAGSYPLGLAFRAPGEGGISIGGVTGIDAAGKSVAGELRFDGRHLDLVLPQAFVANAQLPLVLDPLIGSLLTLDSGADFADPDVAYDETTDDYLVVYERWWSGTDIDVYGQRVSTSGALVGATILMETTVGTLATNPAVGNVNGSERWFACWQESASIFGPWDITGMAITASTGALSASMSVASLAASEIDPDVGSEKLTGFDNCIVVWERDGAGIRGAAIDVNATGTPTVETAFTISTSASAHRPAISKSGGSPGNYMVAYSLFFSTPAPGDHDLYGAVVDYLGTVLDSEAFLVGGIGPNEDDVEVDGDGASFLFAYEKQAVSNDGDHDVFAHRATYTVGTATLAAAGSPVGIEAGLGDDECDPTIAFTGLKYHVAYLDERAPFGYELDLRELDPADCLNCGTAPTSVPASGASLFGPSIASVWNGTNSPLVTEDQTLLAFESVSLTPNFDGTIVGLRWESVGASGASVNLGGGCAGGGVAGTTGVLAPGSPNFTFTLAGASPGAALGLVNVNPGPAAPFPCGTCVGPLPGILVGRPVVAGAASLVLPIPCDSASIGTVWDYDWIVALVPTSPCPLFANVANSNVLRMTVGH
ncbi:MAG: hypothetical protein EPO68_11630 [Planctomycetota bacterium]|nr:MAG: hypothetical protein EPO68_11630 [Planctomycetota bacterium]